VLMA
jgi:transposase